MTTARFTSFRTRFSFLFTLCFVGVLAAVGGQGNPSSAAALAGQAEAGKSFIWQIERGDRTGWLVGSLHLATPDFYPLAPALENAFARADTLMEEVDMRQATEPAMATLVLTKGLNPSGTTLQSLVSPDTFARLGRWFSRSGMALAPFQQMKPWMVAMTVQTLALQQLGFNPEHGIDKHFMDAALRTGKGFIALETIEEQIDFLDGLSPKTQEAMLLDSVNSAESDLAEITALATAWRTGDADAMERLALDSFADTPEVYQSLLVARNRRWLPAIERCIASHSCFVVVGAAHLVGPEGLIVMLRELGYRVTQQ